MTDSRRARSPRDTAWLDVVLADTDRLLCDHAHCERKAVATAMSLIARHPDLDELVAQMSALAAEELEHFREVHAGLVARGIVFAPDQGDPYAQALMAQLHGRGPSERLVDRLILCGLIEDRSCQRLLLLGRHHPDESLREMFLRFARAEANHGPLFLRLARRYCPEAYDVEGRIEELTAIERQLVDDGPIRCAMH